MSYDEYWHGPARLVCDYYDAYIMRRDEQNYFLWLNGAYVYAAMTTALSNMNFDGRHHTTHTYFDNLSKPFQIRAKTDEEKEKERREAEMEIIKSLERFGEAWKEKHG